MRLRRKLHRLIVNATPGAPARDYFALFQIQPELTLDEATLEQSYHALLAQFHPDLYAGQSQMEQRMAAQLCADFNSAYQTLSHEVTRAEYLLSRAGVDLEAAERQGVDPAHCVVIEDSLAGVTAAIRAGMRCLAYVAEGDGVRLSDQGAEIIRHMSEIPERVGF